MLPGGDARGDARGDAGSFTQQALRGVALVDRRLGELVVRRLLPEDLPGGARARFEALFEARRHWELPDVMPYLADVYDEGDTGKALLAKFTRVTQDRPDDAPLYSLR